MNKKLEIGMQLIASIIGGGIVFCMALMGFFTLKNFGLNYQSRDINKDYKTMMFCPQLKAENTNK